MSDDFPATRLGSTAELAPKPNVYACIAAVSGEIAKAGIAKSRKNEQQGYQFRGIDDVYNALAPILAKHGLVILPRMLSREQTERQTRTGGVLFSVVVDAEFDFVSMHDQSTHTTKAFGEAMDSADKATNKAMSAAYKYTTLQTFCIPTEGDNDADRHTPEEIVATDAAPIPVVPPAPQTPVKAPARAATTPTPGALRVTLAKVAKEGSNAKGPWTLYAVKFSDGREGTTFSKAIYGAAQEAAAIGCEVDAELVAGSGKTLNLVGLKPVFQVRETAPREYEEAPF